MNIWTESDYEVLNTQELYNKFGSELTYTTIKVVPDDLQVGDNGYDLYNEFEELACMNGESVYVEHINGYVKCISDMGMGIVTFLLTEEEYEIASSG